MRLDKIQFDLNNHKSKCRNSFTRTLILFLVDSFTTKPMIRPNQADLTAVSGENVRLECQSTAPVHWRFHVIL